MTWRNLIPGLSNNAFYLYGASVVTGTLSGAINSGQYMTVTTDTPPGWNPLTWRNDSPRIIGQMLVAKPTELHLYLSGVTVDQALSVGLDVKLYVKTASGTYVPPLNGPKSVFGSDYIEDWLEGVKLDVLPVSAGVYEVQYDTSAPISEFRLRLPPGATFGWKLRLEETTWGIVTVTTCNLDGIGGGPNQNQYWDNIAAPVTDGAGAVGGWLAKLGWLKDFSRGFSFSVPISPVTPSIKVPIMVPRAGAGGLDIGYVTTTVSDISDHMPLFTPNLYDYGTGGYRQGVTSSGAAGIDTKTSKVIAVVIAAFYIVLRILVTVLALGLLVLVTLALYYVTNAAFPIVSDTFGRVQVSAGLSGVAGIASALAFILMAGVLVPMYMYLGDKCLFIADFFRDGVLPYVDFAIFALVRNSTADWATFAGTVNIVGNTLFIAVPLYAIWRAIQFLGKA